MAAQQAPAQELFREAFENRYTWDEGFPGYRAEIAYFPKEGDSSLSFSGVVSIDRNRKIDVAGVENEEICQKIREQMWEIMVHRVRHSFDEEHGGHTFVYGESQNSDITEVLVSGLSSTDRYWVQGKHIQRVHRHLANRTITVSVQEFYDTGEGYLPTHYTAEYCSSGTEEKPQAKMIYEDRYQKIGQYWIPVERRIWEEQDGKKSASPQLFLFSNIRFFE